MAQQRLGSDTIELQIMAMRNLTFRWGNPRWQGSSRDPRIWRNSPPWEPRHGPESQQQQQQQHQQLYYRREELDFGSSEGYSRFRKNGPRFDSLFDSTREPNPGLFHFSDQNLGPGDARLRLRDQGGHRSQEPERRSDPRPLPERDQPNDSKLEALADSRDQVSKATTTCQ